MAGRFSVEAVFKAVDRITAPVSRMQNRVGKFTRAMSRGLRTANRHVDKLIRGMGRGVGRVAKFGGALAAVGAVAVTSALNRTAAAADSLAKQSRRLDFPIEDLQEWKFVAEQSGVSNELLDKSLGAFSKRLGEAQNGLGPLVSGLKDLNPELLAQLQSTDDVSEAFGIYIDAIRASDSATEKAALANAAFSRSGLDLVNIADNSSEAISALRMEQRENGNITMEQAVAAEAYGDAVNSLKRGLMGMMHQVLLPMMPMITANVRQWREWIVANREMIQTRVIEFVRNLWRRLKDLALAVVEFNNRYDLGERLSEGLDVLGRFARYLSENGALILKLVAGVVIVSTVLKTLAGVLAIVNIALATSPITWIVLGVIALVAALVMLGVWLWSIRDKLLAFAQVAIDKVVAAVVWLKDTFLSLPKPIQAAIAFILGPVGMLAAAAVWVSESWEPISAFFSDLWAGVIGAFLGAPSITEGALAAFAVAGDYIAEAWAGVAAFFRGVWANVKAAFGNIPTPEGGPLAAFIAIVGTIYEVWAGIITFFYDLWAGVIGAFLGAPSITEGALAAFASASDTIMAAWDGVGAFFSDMWAGITDTFDSALSGITSVTDKVKNAANAVGGTMSSIGDGVSDFFSFGGDDDEAATGGGSQVVSPQERTARSIEETRTTSAAEVTIRDDTGRAEVTKGPLNRALSLQSSGAF